MSCERATVALVTAMVLGVSEGVWILARWGAVVPGAWAKFLLLLAVLLCYTTLAALLAPIEAATAPLVGCLSKLLGGKDRWADRLWSVGIVSSVVLLWIVRPHHVDPILDFIMFTIDAVWGEGAAPESRVLPLLIFCLVVLASLWSSSALFRRYGQPGARGRLLVVVGAIGTGQWLLWYQASHNENQYPYIHGLMCIAAFMSLRQAVNAALGGRAIRSSRVWIMGWLALIGSGVSLNFMLDNSRATEARLMFNSDGARSVVFFLRSLWDDDGDGYSPHFGGDDTDDRNPNVHPGNRERPGDGMDNDGWGGDCPDGPLADNAHRSLAKPQFTLSRPMRRILCISVDALRMDAMDHAPMLSVLSRNHVSFTSARASGALTMTSYWSFLRGLTPRLFSISDQSTFVESLRHSNIPTAAVLCDFFPREFVFDRSYGDISGDDTSPSSASTTATLQAWSELPDRGFCWVHYIDPHAPYEARGAARWSDSDKVRYFSEIRATDSEIDRLLIRTRALEDDDVAVVIFSDHGEAFGEHRGQHHGLSVYEEILRTPLLLCVPGLAPRSLSSNVSLADLAPTILDLMHIEAPARMRGRSLLPLAQGGDDPKYNRAMAAANHMGLNCFISSDQHWKLIWDISRCTLELYDLWADPSELHNLVDDRPEKLSAIRNERDLWFSNHAPN